MRNAMRITAKLSDFSFERLSQYRIAQKTPKSLFGRNN